MEEEFMATDHQPLATGKKCTVDETRSYGDALIAKMHARAAGHLIKGNRG